MREIKFPAPIASLKIGAYIRPDNDEEIIIHVLTKDQAIAIRLDLIAQLTCKKAVNAQ